jgi:precorrin-2 dehydrogenase/sirohydrochlorin ferrochelatase
MKYYPVFLRVTGCRCLVVGGGSVAQRKVESLLQAGADVTIVSPDLTETLCSWASSGRLHLQQRDYQSSDMNGQLLAFAATDDEALQQRIAADAATAGVLLNVVDRPALCSFIVPALCERGDLLIATSTSGTSPAMAKRICRQLETVFGPEYETALLILGRLRERLAAADWPSTQRQRVFGALVDSALLDHLRAGELDAVDRLLATTIGADVTLASLGVAT